MCDFTNLIYIFTGDNSIKIMCYLNHGRKTKWPFLCDGSSIALVWKLIIEVGCDMMIDGSVQVLYLMTDKRD